MICPPQLSGSLIQLTVNGERITSNLYSFKSGGIPIISNLDIKSSSPTKKRDIVITGTNFGSDKSQFECLMNSETEFPAYTLDIIKSTPTSITCRLKGGKIGDYKMVINKNGFGSSGVSSVGVNEFKYELNIDSISPISGSKAGGTILTIKGKNFSPTKNNNQVFIGGSNVICLVIEATETELKCKTGPMPEEYSGENNVVVSQRVVQEAKCIGTCKFTYSDHHTPKITNDNQVLIHVSAGKNFSFQGQLFGSNLNEIKVVINKIEYSALSVNDSLVVFEMPALIEGTYSLNIYRKGYGLALGGPFILKNEILVESIFPRQGSIRGSEFTIMGSGFKNSSIVFIGDNKMQILSIKPNKITVLPKENSIFSNNKKNVVKVYPDENLKNLKTCDICNYVGLDSKTIRTTSIVGELVSSTYKILVKGLNFGESYNVKAYAYIKLTDDNGEISLHKNIGKVTNKQKTQMNVEFSNFSAGTYNFEFDFETYGFAKNDKDAYQTILPTFKKISKVKASYAGGAILTVSGEGFYSNPDYMKIANDVRLCGFKCILSSATFTEINCHIPTILTKDSQEKLNLMNEEKISYSVEVKSGTSRSRVKNINDGLTNTFYMLNHKDCFILLDFGENMQVKITKLNYFIKMRTDHFGFLKSYFEASNDKVNWDKLFVPEFVVTDFNKWVAPKSLNKTYR